MSNRSFSSPSYRYGFNGMEKDDEVKGQGNSYTTEFRFLDTRLGRWLSLDPKTKIKPFISVYVVMSNCPISKKDPKGDDDYYDETGRLLFQNETETNEIKVIKRADFNSLRDASFNEYKKTNPKISKELYESIIYKPDIKKLDAKSIIVKVQSDEEQKKVMTAMEEKTTADGLETSGNIILEINLDPNTKQLTSANLYLEIDSKATRYKDHIDRPSYKYKNDDPDIHFTNNGKMNKIIVGAIHTHPQENGKDMHGPSTTESHAVDGYVDTDVSQKCKCDEFVLDKDLYRATPGGETEKLEKGTTNVAKEALKTHSANH
jgi:RHS repeat-associated protein